MRACDQANRARCGLACWLHHLRGHGCPTLPTADVPECVNGWVVAGRVWLDGEAVAHQLGEAAAAHEEYAACPDATQWDAAVAYTMRTMHQQVSDAIMQARLAALHTPDKL